MPIKIIGKTILGEVGFCHNPSKMGESYYMQLKKIRQQLPKKKKLVMTSMTNEEEVEETKGEYLPKMLVYDPAISELFNPESIYVYCKKKLELCRPKFDFAIARAYRENITIATFSREDPILAFTSSNGNIALGTIMSTSLMRHGDYLFKTMKEALEGDITVNLVTCNHNCYENGSIPSKVEKLANQYGMDCIIGVDSEEYSECYHRGEKGYHVVAMWCEPNNM